MRKGKHGVVGVTGAVEAGDAPHRDEAIANESDDLIIASSEESSCELAFRRRDEINISQELILVEGAWLGYDGEAGFERSTLCGVGIRKEPSGNLKFNNAIATGLMLDPSGATAIPPNPPFMPPNNRPIAEADLSFVKAGSIKLALHAILACPAARPLRWWVPWYEPKTNNLSFLIGPPSASPN
jgi:hypothetical protein